MAPGKGSNIIYLKAVFCCGLKYAGKIYVLCYVLEPSYLTGELKNQRMNAKEY